MSYATKQDMIDRFGETELVQITNQEDHAATVINDTVLNQALADADAEIDGYLIGRYALPLASVPATLKRNACDIARYHLYDNRVTEQVQKRYDNVVAFLRMLAKGDASLGLDAAHQETPTTGGPAIAAGDRVFTADSLKDY
ncbi:MAG: DUF1320 domain-containing protein [Burkholderiales bacterium]|nr:DUF1320 domain-containing protein [Burkholderiales bacterium]